MAGQMLRDAMEGKRQAVDTLLMKIKRFGSLSMDERKEIETFFFEGRTELEGNSYYQYFLGHMYFSGNCVEKKDQERAIDYFGKAAEQNNVNALCCLGDIKEKGYGFEIDIPKALELYRRAAELGDGDSASRLGQLYNQGEKVERDEKEAFRWWLMSAERGVIEDMNNIAIMYCYGRGVAENTERGFRWFRRLLDNKPKLNVFVAARIITNMEKTLQETVSESLHARYRSILSEPEIEMKS
ncbi:MAG: hypothetical protein Hyperionvirus22_27 [Hyperionvirus sp.]|uniref:Sel1 repeat family protein n=1 Tax=Hyperionvirus sp. TaxID=2487770 RepID=A0A3G5AAS3_9VIRU|nr:MAG: hypothetical protein Hyperionvirus22_27 [Hyperionvirus sp.]